MSLEPVGWSVVLIGRWNKAILSPKGIGKYVFKLPEGTKIHINVPIDGVSPYLVVNPEETLRVHVEMERLQIDLLKCTYEILGHAMNAGFNVLVALPVTPITAIGFNINFKSAEAPDELIRSIECGIDSKIAVNGMESVGRSLGRSLRFKDGVTNLSINWTGGEYLVNSNFHLDTADVEKAKEWLKIPMESIKEQIQKISSMLGIELSE